MKVYVVTENIDYEGASPVLICSRLETALALCSPWEEDKCGDGSPRWTHHVDRSAGASCEASKHCFADRLVCVEWEVEP